MCDGVKGATLQIIQSSRVCRRQPYFLGSGNLREVTSRRVSKRTRSSGVYRARKARLGMIPLEKEANVEKNTTSAE